MGLLDSLNIGSGPGQIPLWQVLASSIPQIAGTALSVAGPGTGGGMLGAGLQGIGQVMGGLTQAGQQHQTNQRLGQLLGKNLTPQQGAVEAGNEGINLGDYFKLLKQMQPAPQQLVEAVGPGGQNMFVPRAAGPLAQGVQFGDIYKQGQQQKYEQEKTQFVQSSEDARQKASLALREYQHQMDMAQRAQLAGNAQGAENARAAANRANQLYLKQLEIANRPKPQTQLEKDMGGSATKNFAVLDPSTMEPIKTGATSLTTGDAIQQAEAGQALLVPTSEKKVFDLANDSLKGLNNVRAAGAKFLPSEAGGKGGPLGLYTRFITKGKQYGTQTPERSRYNAATANLISAVRTMAQGRLNKTELDQVLGPVQNASSQEQLDAALGELEKTIQETRNSTIKYGNMPGKASMPGGLSTSIRESSIGGTAPAPMGQPTGAGLPTGAVGRTSKPDGSVWNKGGKKYIVKGGAVFPLN